MKKYLVVIGLIVSFLIVINYPVSYSYFSLLYLFLMAIVAVTYHNFDHDFDCSCDVIIPVFNEGEHIYETVQSVSKSDYKNFKIIIVDDGSTDDSKEWIEKSKELYDNIETIYFEQNKGKKHALAAGVAKSQADVIITIDSDSIISEDAITNIVKPFKNKKIGAVAGNVNVKNLVAGLIPKLMDIIFVFSYELIRCSQSRFGTVLCTPGALSAYRREAVLPLIDEWLNQKFMGEETMIGEDRALTCLLIKSKWEIVYQESAKAYTNMPVNYNGLCKMLLRWVRGDIRENILLFNYVFGEFSFTNIKSWGLAFHYIIFNIGILSPIVLLPMIVIYACCKLPYLLIMLPYCSLMLVILSIIPMVVYIRKKSYKYAIHSLTYSVFSLLFLSWIPLWAVLTLKNNKWLTRK